MATITIDDAELGEIVREHVQKAVAEYLANRVIPDYPAYFFEGDWLVTYDWLKHVVAREIATSENRMLKEIRKPWWKRW